jgi:copper(I)-binding protein
MKQSFLISLAVLVLAMPQVYAAGAADSIRVSDAYARAVPPGQPNSAFFMVLENTADRDHALVAAESGVAKAVELHNHSMEGSMMRMRRVEQIGLGAGESVALRPGGLHVMLIGLIRQLEPGQRVDLTLVFEDGSRSDVEAPVRRVSVNGGTHKADRCGSGRCGGGP